MVGKRYIRRSLNFREIHSRSHGGISDTGLVKFNQIHWEQNTGVHKPLNLYRGRLESFMFTIPFFFSTFFTALWIRHAVTKHRIKKLSRVTVAYELPGFNRENPLTRVHLPCVACVSHRDRWACPPIYMWQHAMVMCRRWLICCLPYNLSYLLSDLDLRWIHIRPAAAWN